MAFLVKHAEIQPAANQIARLLSAAGISARGVVAVLLPNGPEMLFCYRAVSWSGKTWTPISYQLPVDDVRYILGDSGAEIFIAHAQFKAVAVAAASDIPAQRCFSVGGDIEGFQPLEAYRQLPDTSLEVPLAGGVMMYTSGTTGRPKGVSRPALEPAPPPSYITRMGAGMMQHFLGEKAGGTHLVAAPLYHAAANTYCDGAVECGADIVIMTHWDGEEFLRLVTEHQVISTFLVPTHFVRLLKLPEATRHSYQLDSLQLVSHGGAPTPVHIKRAMIEWLGPILFESYGGTEGGGIHISSQEWLAHPGSVGKPGAQLALTILDEQAKPCPIGTVGSVYMASPEPFEYLNDPQKTTANRQGSLFTLGDMGRLDEQGYLYLCDRRSDLIISGGVNVYPAQVEGKLLQHPQVDDCCVIGLDDEDWGQQVCAIIQCAPGVDEAALADELTNFCLQQLAPAERPRQLFFEHQLPRTATGKLLHRKMREQYQAMQGDKRKVDEYDR